MDKALEVIMVAVILIVAAVVILAMLQGRTGDFSEYTKNQTESGNCGLLRVRYESNLNCDSNPSSPETGAAQGIENKADGQNCGWSQPGTDIPGSSFCS